MSVNCVIFVDSVDGLQRPSHITPGWDLEKSWNFVIFNINHERWYLNQKKWADNKYFTLNF